MIKENLVIKYRDIRGCYHLNGLYLVYIIQSFIYFFAPFWN